MASQGRLVTVATGDLAPSSVALGVAEWAARDPERSAMGDNQRTVTFGEFDAVVGGWAAQIHERHEVGDAFTPVIVDRSIDAAMAMHAVVRAARAFTAIESTTPKPRVAELFARLGHPPSAVISRPEHAALLPDGVRAIPQPTRDGPRISPLPFDSDSVGYVVFTSGSTGRPKGVVRHWSAWDRGLIAQEVESGSGRENWRLASLQQFSFGAGHRYLKAVALGRTVFIADPSGMSPEAMVEWFVRHRINETSISPTLAATLFGGARGSARLPDLEYVRLGTEGSSWDLVPPLRRLVGPQLTITSGYGATEAGPRLFAYEIPPDAPVGAGRIPLGVVVDASRIRFEHIDGPDSPTQLLARPGADVSYLDDDELNATRFVTDTQGIRWWISGDLIEVGADGLYYHRGRVDDMVKINGMLVEPREAEEVLRAIPGVRDAAVLGQTTASGKSRLIAHVCVDDGLAPEVVRARLDDVLPRYLVPALLMRHAVMPRSERGKLDRAALSAAPLERWRERPARVPTIEAEVWLVGCVSELLDVGDIGPDDDVWQLGLDSLGVVELCARVSAAGFGELDPRVLLEDRTIAALSSRLLSEGAGDRSPVATLHPDGELTPLFAIPGGGGTSLAFRALADRLGADHPIVVVEPMGLHVRGRPDRSIEAQARRARAEIEQRLVGADVCVLLGYSAGGTVAYELAQQIHRDGRDVRLVLLDAAPGRRDAPKPHESRDEEHAAAPSKLRGRAPLEVLSMLPGVAVRRTRRRCRRLMLKARIRFPNLPLGRPTYNQAYYREFRKLLGRAVKRYELEPAQFPVTLVYVDGSTTPENCRAVIPQVQCHRVGGDHYSMLQPPHVAGLAAVISSVLTEATA